MTPHLVPTIIIGVDTHKDKHVAVALDGQGTILRRRSIKADTGGYLDLEQWALTVGKIKAFGVEGTGSYGAGLSLLLLARGHRVIEVSRPNRLIRARHGKNDHLDAEGAARSVLNGQATAVPKPNDGTVEMIRQLKIVRDTAVKSKAAGLQAAHGIATMTIADMLILIGDDTAGIKSEAALARLCGVCPIPASSGRTNRFRLNRGGNRQANAALYRVAIVRMRTHPPTLDYLIKKTADGKTRGEIIRCLKRYIVREIFNALCRPKEARLPT